MEEIKNKGEYKVKKEDVQKMLFFLNKESNKTVKDDFDTVEMRVRSFKFTPFNEFALQQRNLG